MPSSPVLPGALLPDNARSCDSAAILQAMDSAPRSASQWGTLRLCDAKGDTPRDIPLSGSKVLVVGRTEEVNAM